MWEIFSKAAHHQQMRIMDQTSIMELFAKVIYS